MVLEAPALSLVCRATIPGNIRYRRPSANFAGGSNREYHGSSIIHLRDMFRAHVGSRKNRDERRRSRGLLYAGPSLRFLALDQAHDAGDFKSEVACRLNSLHCGSARGADIVDDDNARAFVAKTYNALAGP